MASCMRRIAVTADDQHAGRHLRAFNAWVDDLRETYRHRPTVRDELDRAGL